MILTYLCVAALILAHQTAEALAPMKYPLTIGGFRGRTELHHLLVDSAGGLILGGRITLPDPTNQAYSTYEYFLAYLKDGDAEYSWFMGYGYSYFSKIALS